MLFGAVFTERDAISLKAEYHEEAHCNQSYNVLFWYVYIVAYNRIVSLIPIFLYYSWYLIEYLIRLCIYRNHDKAYHNIVFEREAFDLEKYWNKHDVLRKESKGFSFLKYYGKEYYHE